MLGHSVLASMSKSESVFCDIILFMIRRDYSFRSSESLLEKAKLFFM